MPALEPSCLYPSERELALLILGKDRAHQWPAFAVVEERHGLPPVDQLLGGRYWPDVSAYLQRRSARAVPVPAPSARTRAWEPKLDGSGVDLATPGLHGQRRRGERVDYYWRPLQHLVRAGCPMKAVRVHGDVNCAADLPKMASICQRLQTELLAWSPNITAGKSRFAEGTLGHLCDAYERDAGARELRHATRKFYSRSLKLLTERAGDQNLAGISGRIIRTWFNEWRAQRSWREAYACIQTLRVVASYGIECAVSKGDPCFFLREILGRVEFEQPKRRSKKLTRDLVNAFVAAADGDHAPALVTALLLQFELSLRQKDVIGEWVPGEDGGSKVWIWGLTWDQIDENWILRKPTSKSNGGQIAEHDLTHLPDLLSRLQSTPPDQRVGAIIQNVRTGSPYRREYFSRAFRSVANAAGWPKDLWNMDSRAGAVSEAFEAGADPADVMKSATHTQMSTTMSYNRGGLEQTRRVAKMRAGRRAAIDALASGKEKP